MNDSLKSMKGIVREGLSRPVTAITILDTLILLLLFLYLGFFFYRSLVVLFFPYAFPLEVPYVVMVRMLGEGGSLYELYDLNRSDIKLLCTYGPVHPLLVGFLVHFFGFSFILGRLVSLVFCLSVGVIIFLFVWRETRDTFCSTVSTLIFFASPWVYDWVACFRSLEFLGITFCFIGMYIIQYYRHSKWVYTSAVFFTLGVYTKLYLVSAPLAALIYLLLEDRRLAIRIGSLFLLFSTAVFLSLNHITHGQYYANIVAARIFMGDFEMYGAPYFYTLFIMCPVLIGLVTVFLLNGMQRERYSLFSFWFIAALLITFYVSGYESWFHYLIEPFGVICIISGITLSYVRQILKAGLPLLPSSIVLVQALCLFHAPFLPQKVQDHYFFSNYTPLPTLQERNYLDRVSKIVDSAKGKVLSLDGTFLRDGNPAELVLVDYHKYPSVVSAGLGDDSSFINRIRSKEFALIVCAPDYKNPYLECVKEYYTLKEKVGPFRLYRPKEE